MNMSFIHKGKGKVFYNLRYRGDKNPFILLADIGLDIRQKIIKRTKSGYDINGRKFQKYSGYSETNELTGYAKAKRDGTAKSDGRRSMGKDVSVVDLELGGSMLKGLHVKPNHYEVLVYPTEHAEVGFYHNEGLGVPKREWWGIDQKMKKEIKAMLHKWIGIQ